MKGILYDVVKGNKSNTFYIIGALIATVLNVSLWFIVTVNPNASVKNEVLGNVIGFVTPIGHVVLLIISIYLLCIMYRVESDDIVYERVNVFVEKEYVDKKRVNIIKIPHFVYAQYKNDFINIYAYDENDNIMKVYQTKCYVEFLKEVNPMALNKIKRSVRLCDVFKKIF